MVNILSNGIIVAGIPVPLGWISPLSRTRLAVTNGHISRGFDSMASCDSRALPILLCCAILSNSTQTVKMHLWEYIFLISSFQDFGQQRSVQCTSFLKELSFFSAIYSQCRGLEGVKTPKKLTGAGVKCMMCINTIPVTTQNLKIGQRGNPELCQILSFFTYFMVGWVGAPT